MRTDRERLVALAGIYQSAYLTQQIARRGIADTDALEACIYSLFQIDAPSVEAVYGDLKKLSIGLQQLHKHLNSLGKHDMEVTRYVLSLWHLERKLVKNPSMLKQIADGISQAAERLEHFPLLHPNILAQLADIYAGSISTLQPRIMVNGEPMHLQNPENTNKIRALLLAGIRASLLWRQCGGNRLQVFLGRRRLIRLSQDLLHEIDED
jgi:high frequency lysogenization protein